MKNAAQSWRDPLEGQHSSSENDAAAKELEDLLRDALNSTGLESQRGSSPLIQLKTVPLQVQHIPTRPAAPAQAPIEASPESISGLADQLAPESIRPGALGQSPSKPRRTSLVALAVLGVFALAAAGAATWLARTRHIVPSERASTTTTTTTTTATAAHPTPEEGAVGISVAARPADAPTAATADEANAPTAPVATPASTDTAVASVSSETPPEAKAKPIAPVAPSTKSDVRPSEKTADKVEKNDKPETRAATSPPPSAAPAGGSVDALLQQQLNGALP